MCASQEIQQVASGRQITERLRSLGGRGVCGGASLWGGNKIMGPFSLLVPCSGVSG